MNVKNIFFLNSAILLLMTCSHRALQSVSQHPHHDDASQWKSILEKAHCECDKLALAYQRLTV